MPIFKELKKRNVFRVAAAYVVTAWLLIEIGNTLEETLNLPGWADTLLAFFLILGFPFVLFFSWAYEITPEGIKRERDIEDGSTARAATAGRLNRILIVVMSIALAYFAADKFFWSGSDPKETLTQAASVDASAQPAHTEPMSLAPDKSIAVLPFVNMSSDPEQEYFSDGLTEELLNLLAGVGELKVAARTSSFYFKNKLDQVPLEEVARQLEVAHILEGSVRKGGDKIRVTAQLIKADDGFHLWSATYDRTLDDVFAIQDEIAAAVVEQLRLTLLGEAPHTRAIDAESYQLALEGRFLYHRRNSGDLLRALSLFERAAELDPNNSIAWIGMTPLYLFVFDPPRLEEAMAAADRALQLEPDNPEALARKAQCLLVSGNAKTEGAALWERAVELGPNNSLILAMQAGQLMDEGRLEEGLNWQRRALAVDPLNLIALGNAASYLLELGRWNEARPYVEKLGELAPGSVQAVETRAYLLLQQGRPEESLALIGSLSAPLPEDLMMVSDNRWLALRVMAMHDLGREAEAIGLLSASVPGELERYKDDAPFNIAPLFAYLGELDLAFEWIERGLANDPSPRVRRFLDWRYGPIMEDPRWQRVRALFPDFDGWDTFFAPAASAAND